MWTRGELKDRAKVILKSNYWVMLLVSVIMGLLSSDSSGFQSTWRTNSKEFKMSPFWNQSGGAFDMSPSEIIAALFIGVMAISFFILIAIAIRALIGYSVEVGGKKFFIRAAQGSVDMNTLGFAFRKDRYAKIIVTQLRKDIQLFLWSLLFVIPGIIKFYSYYLVPYLLAENPAIGSGRAIELSRSLMDGHKWDVFILNLSFIGWYILGLMALVIGVIFVMPYVRATDAELYLRLKEIGLQKGLCQYEEFEFESYSEA